MTRSKQAFIALLTIAFFGALYLTNCAQNHSDLPANVTAPHSNSLLMALPVAPEHRDGYIRNDWPHWIETPMSCLNTRERVLIRDSLEAVVLDPSGCRIVSGLWFDPYTAEQFRDPRALDIDHVVPLEEAYESGGYSWTQAQRRAYANDIVHTDALAAVSAKANRSKGSKSPDQWLPDNTQYRCVYIKRWISVKSEWKLSIDAAEEAFLESALEKCP